MSCHVSVAWLSNRGSPKFASRIDFSSICVNIDSNCLATAGNAAFWFVSAW